MKVASQHVKPGTQANDLMDQSNAGHQMQGKICKGRRRKWRRDQKNVKIRGEDEHWENVHLLRLGGAKALLSLVVESKPALKGLR